MKLVIDIPNRLYKAIHESDRIVLGDKYTDTVIKRIKNGTPLPKGHGRLLNADDVYDAFSPYVSFSDLYDVLDEIPTIIEADM